MPRRMTLRCLGLALLLGATGAASAEDLNQAWGIALTVNQQIQATRFSTDAAGFDQFIGLNDW